MEKHRQFGPAPNDPEETELCAFRCDSLVEGKLVAALPGVDFEDAGGESFGQLHQVRACNHRVRGDSRENHQPQVIGILCCRQPGRIACAGVVKQPCQA